MTLNKTSVFLCLLVFLYGCSNSGIPAPNDPISGSEITYPKEYSYDEVLYFEKNFIGSWHTFNPPKDKYDADYFCMVICPDDTPLPMYDLKDVFEENGYYNVFLYGTFSGYCYPFYWIDKVTKTSELTYDVDLSFIGDDSHIDLIRGFTINVIDTDNIDVHFVLNEKEYMPINSEYHFERMSKGYDVSMRYYINWMKENNYENVYIPADDEAELE